MRHIHCKLLLAFAFLAFALPAFAAETRGVKRVEIKTQAGELVGLYEESHALVIGVSDYTAGWPDLESVTKDVQEVSSALEGQGFNVVRVLNPTKLKLVAAFSNFIDQYGYDPDNRLLFYYSGHGYTQELHGRPVGYLVPSDAPNPNEDRKGFSRRSLRMTQILSWSKQIEAKHALFLFDSCFSGSVLKERALVVPQQIRRATSKPVRQFISAGSAGQTVPADSIFRPSFIRGIRGEGDLDKDGYVTGTELGLFLQKRVASYDTGQTPQFGKIKDPIYDEGDFVFALPKVVTEPEPSSTAAAPAPAPSQFLPDEEMWKELQDSDSPEDFEDFLAAFPESKLAPVARIKLKRLKRKQAKAQAEEKQLAEEAKQLEAERKRLEVEKKQIAEAKRKAEEEQKRKQEEERKHQLAEEAKQLEEERQRLAAEKQQMAEAKRKAEEEQKRKQEEERKRQLAEEAKREEEERKREEAEQRRLAEAKRKADTDKIKEDYDWAIREGVSETYQLFLDRYEDNPQASRFIREIRQRALTERKREEERKRLEAEKKRIAEAKRKAEEEQKRKLEDYEAIVKANEDTVGCGFLSFGCEDPLMLPPYDSGFHLKHYRRVKVYANRYPWISSEIELEHGDRVLVFASGKVTICRHQTCIDQPPNRFLTMRIGESGDFLMRFAYRDFSAQGSGELQFIVKDWDTYPPSQNYYSDNTGSYLLDVFVYDNENKEGFQQLLWAMAKQNPEDTEFQESTGVLWTEPVTGMKFQKILGGSFIMGSPSSEQGRSQDEGQHTVRVDVFWLAETEVTQAQWQAVMGSNPSRFRGDDRPVEQVSFYDVQEFIKKLNARFQGFRLPTEAEWEYAARAGTGTARHWGEAIGRNHANCDGCGSRWDEQTAPVRSFTANAFGLHDMLGNVEEWTCSEYKDHYDGREKKCADRASYYSLRGGSWLNKPRFVRAADRGDVYPVGRNDSIGFRLARD